VLHYTFFQFLANVFATDEGLVSDLFDQLEPVEEFIFELIILIANSKAQDNLDEIVHKRRENCDAHDIHKHAYHFFTDTGWKQITVANCGQQCEGEIH
jgi:hypothetical protein